MTKAGSDEERRGSGARWRQLNLSAANGCETFAITSWSWSWRWSRCWLRLPSQWYTALPIRLPLLFPPPVLTTRLLSCLLQVVAANENDLAGWGPWGISTTFNLSSSKYKSSVKFALRFAAHQTCTIRAARGGKGRGCGDWQIAKGGHTQKLLHNFGRRWRRCVYFGIKRGSVNSKSLEVGGGLLEVQGTSPAGVDTRVIVRLMLRKCYKFMQMQILFAFRILQVYLNSLSTNRRTWGRAPCHAFCSCSFCCFAFSFSFFWQQKKKHRNKVLQHQHPKEINCNSQLATCSCRTALW